MTEPLANPTPIFDVLFFLFGILGFLFVFPCPLFLFIYRKYRHERHLIAVNERFMREWKSREQSK